MKRVSAMGLALLVIGMLAACAIAAPPDIGTLIPSKYADTDFDTTGDLVIEPEYAVYGMDTQQVTYYITNNTADELVYGVQYALEVCLDGKWYQIPFPENTAWIEIGIILKSFDTNAESFSFSALDYTFGTGQYRLVKELGGKLFSMMFQIDFSPVAEEPPLGYTDLEKLPVDYLPEVAEKNGDIVILPDGIKNPDRLMSFIQQTTLGKPAMIRFSEYTSEGAVIITDCIYNNNQRGYYVFRQDNSRGRLDGDVGITSTIYSFLISDGTNLYLSNCTDWELISTYKNADTVLLMLATDSCDLSEPVSLVAQATENRLAETSMRYKVCSPDGCHSVALSADPLSYGYGNKSLEQGQLQKAADPDGYAVRITDVIWLNNDAYVLVLDTCSARQYFKVVGSSDNVSGYGTVYKITDDHFEIIS